MIDRLKHELQLGMEGGLNSEEVRKKELTRLKDQAIEQAHEKWTKQETTKNKANKDRLEDRLKTLKAEEQ